MITSAVCVIDYTESFLLAKYSMYNVTWFSVQCFESMSHKDGAQCNTSLAPLASSFICVNAGIRILTARDVKLHRLCMCEGVWMCEGMNMLMWACVPVWYITPVCRRTIKRQAKRVLFVSQYTLVTFSTWREKCVVLSSNWHSISYCGHVFWLQYLVVVTRLQQKMSVLLMLNAHDVGCLFATDTHRKSYY